LEIVGTRLLTVRLHHTMFQPGAHRQKGGFRPKQKDRSESGLPYVK
jgi:hypothetical protein